VRTEIETLVLRRSTLRLLAFFFFVEFAETDRHNQAQSSSRSRDLRDLHKKEYAVADETSTAEAVNQKQVRLDEPKRERREHRLGGEPGPQSGEKRLRDTSDHPKREGGIRFEAHEPRSRNRRGYGGGKLLSHLSRRSGNTGKMRRSFKTQQTERSLEPKWLAAEISLG
jgi:hypothetical protein